MSYVKTDKDGRRYLQAKNGKKLYLKEGAAKKPFGNLKNLANKAPKKKYA